MKTLSHGNSFRITGPLWGKLTSPHKGPVMRNFIFVASLDKPLNQIAGDLKHNFHVLNPKTFFLIYTNLWIHIIWGDAT